ncbi:MAG: phosphate ABC transporter ATP-binding protein [Candidatus Cloacimonadota bacterium]|nr:MAG: phosphate ABC transporter ATP-binding protein [Candidatus Cloacimonadota bacterium]
MLKINDFSAGYGNTQVLFNINLHIKKGDILGIIGPSGSGKSTLLRCLNRINEEDSNFYQNGEILLNGKDLLDINTPLHEIRKTVGLVFQKPCIFPCSIIDNVLFGLKFERNLTELQKRKLTEEILVDVGLFDEVKDRLKSSAQELSVGQQQRLCIARALILKPKILLLDEPTASLDPDTTNNIEQLVQSFAKKITTVFVTHNMEQARRTCNRVLVLNKGRVVQDGTKEQVFKAGTNPLFSSLIAQV